MIRQLYLANIKEFAIKTPKAIFIDLDGTLLGEDLSISDLDRSAILQVDQQGVEVILASGRPVQAIAQTVSSLGVGRFVIASNGGCVVDLAEGSVLDFSSIDTRYVRGVIKAAYQSGVTPTIYSATKWFAERLDVNVALEQERANIDPNLVSFDTFPEPIIKILNIGDKAPLKQLEDSLKEYRNELEWYYTYPEYLEVMREGVSKGHARDFLADYLGVSLHETMAIGDGLNDCTLIQGAGIGVAMANGNPNLKKVADYITTSNQENGVAAAIWGLVFGQQKYLKELDQQSNL